jgi:hypothetical protein
MPVENSQLRLGGRVHFQFSICIVPQETEHLFSGHLLLVPER